MKANLVISQDDATSSMGGMGALFGSNALVDDEVFAVSSHTVYKKVAQKLGLDQLHHTRTGFLKTRFQYTGYPVTLQYPHEIPDTLCSTLVFKVKADKEGKADITVKVKRDVIAEVKDAKFPVTMKTPYGVFVLEKTPDYPKDENVKTTITLSGYDDAAEFIAKKVLVDIASRKSNVIELEMESADTDYAKAVLNSIIEQYNLRGLQEKNTTNLKTLKFIDSRLELLGQDLLSSESTIESFKKGHGIVDVSSEASYQISKKGQFEAQLITTETQLEIIRMIKDFITDPANKYELVPSSLMGGGEIGSRALDSYNQLLLRRISLLQEVHPGNATLKTLNGQIDALRKNIIESIDRNTESINIKLRDLRAEMGQTQARLGSATSCASSQSRNSSISSCSNSARRPPCSLPTPSSKEKSSTKHTPSTSLSDWAQSRCCSSPCSSASPSEPDGCTSRNCSATSSSPARSWRPLPTCLFSERCVPTARAAT